MSPSLSLRRWLETRLSAADLPWLRTAAAEIYD